MSRMIEKQDYGEVSNLDILTVFGAEISYNQLKYIEKNKQSTTHLRVEYNAVEKDDTQLITVWFNSEKVIDKKISTSCDMLYFLGELENGYLEEQHYY